MKLAKPLLYSFVSLWRHWCLKIARVFPNSWLVIAQSCRNKRSADSDKVLGNSVHNYELFDIDQEELKNQGEKNQFDGSSSI